MLRNLKNNKAGFTLMEVLIGMMVLTVAIVSATQLLVGLININKANVGTMQAYYLAQEGLEAVRNIRDTNWLHNAHFKGDDQSVYRLEEGRVYSVYLRSEGFSASTFSDKDLSVETLRTQYSPWGFDALGAVGHIDPYNPRFALSLNQAGGAKFYSQGEEEKFYRHVEILPGCEDDFVGECGFVLVRSVVNWKDGPRDFDVFLETKLSDWKGGAI